MTFIDLVKNDARLIRRNSILFGMFIFALYIGTVLKFGLPWLDGYLSNIGLMTEASGRFSEYFPLIISNLMIFTGAILVGGVFSFILLQEKDEDTLRVLYISPLSMGTYLNFRILLVFLVSVVVVFGLFIFVNISMPHIIAFAVSILSAGQWASINFLLLILISKSKVQGMNNGKIVSFIGYILVASWWVPEPWQLFFGLIPPYWMIKAYWLALEGVSHWYIYGIVGLGYQTVVLWYLRKLFLKRIHMELC
jgi:fluoroquinolone transport system permease protein